MPVAVVSTHLPAPTDHVWSDVAARVDRLCSDPDWADLADPTNLAAATLALGAEIAAAVELGTTGVLEHLVAELVLVALQLSKASDADVVATITEELAARERAVVGVRRAP